MTKEKQKKTEVDRVEFGSDLSPDDLDMRKDNDLTKEQKKNSTEEDQNYEKKW